MSSNGPSRHRLHESSLKNTVATTVVDRSHNPRRPSTSTVSIFFFFVTLWSSVEAFTPRSLSSVTPATITSNPLFLSAPVEQDKSKTDNASDGGGDWQDPDAPAGIEGAEFFGGNKQKEEFYDPVAERQAAEEVQQQSDASATYGRFFSSELHQPSETFDNLSTARLGQSLQQKLNSVLYSSQPISPSLNVQYSPQLSWDTPFATSKETSSSSSPLSELQTAKDFYKKIDVAVISGKQLSDTTVELSWELAVVWPTFWAPRVMLSGTSTLTLKDKLNSTADSVTVTKQVDRVFGCPDNNLLPHLSSQIKPRFWDWYHIGMSPSTELMPRETVQKKKYSVYKLPSRLVLAPTILETGTRQTRTAQVIPNHAFTCIIKTMGPQKQDYTPTSPIQVQIGRRKMSGDDEEDGSKNKNQLELSWSIPLSVQYQAINDELSLPGENPEDKEDTFPTCSYQFQPMRQVATMAYGGNVQDPEITDIRKQLYEQVLKDGWKPKLDEDGRPMFFFWQYDAKACYTEEGMGMSIYEWRPALAKSNEVGIELEIDS